MLAGLGLISLAQTYFPLIAGNQKIVRSMKAKIQKKEEKVIRPISHLSIMPSDAHLKEGPVE